MTGLVFKPFRRLDAFETIGWTELWQRPLNGTGEAEPCTTEAVEAAHDIARQALCDGSLEAVVFVEAEGQYYRIPSEHWTAENDPFEGMPSDQLLTWGSSPVPAKFRDLALLFFVDEVEAWEKALSAPSIAAAPPAKHPAWPEERMLAEIAVCEIGNRDKAWTSIFKSRQGEHGWSNEAFRAIWSQARGTQGLTGRPAKPAK